MKDTEKGIKVICSDSSEYEGEILAGSDGTNSSIVGCDGSSSSIRQNMYRRLKEQGRLPASDDTALPYDKICIVGQTPPLNVDDFPELKKDKCEMHQMVGVEKMFTVKNAALTFKQGDGIDRHFP